MPRKIPSSSASRPQASAVAPSFLECIPTEILHHIFSYCLLADNVRLKDPLLCKGPHYRLGTSILRANRNLGAQAKAYLYSSNIFILIRYQEKSSFGDFLKKLNPIPVVSHKKLEDFAHHAMYINMWVMKHANNDYDDSENESDGEGGLRITTCHCGDCDPSTIFNRMLITHQHLHEFCTVFQLCNHFDSGGHMIIQSGTTVHWHQPRPEQMNFMRVLLRKRASGLTTLKKKAELHRQAVLLAPFQDICGGNQIYEYNVFGSEFINIPLLQSLRAKGDLYAVSKDGMGWDLLKLLRRLKSLLDAAAVDITARRSMSRAARLASAYKTLAMHTLENSLAYAELTYIPNDSDDPDKALQSWQFGLACLRRDSFLSAAQCQLRAGDEHAAWHNIDDAVTTSMDFDDLEYEFEFEGGGLNKSYAILLHQHAICDCRTLKERGNWEPEDVKAQLVAALRLDSTNNKIRKDLRTLKTCTKQKPLDFHNSTVRQYPVAHNTDTKIVIPDLPRLWLGTEEMLSSETLEMLERTHGRMRDSNGFSYDEDEEDDDEDSDEGGDDDREIDDSDDDEEDDDGLARDSDYSDTSSHGSFESERHLRAFFKDFDTRLPLDGSVEPDQTTLHRFYAAMEKAGIVDGLVELEGAE